MSSGPTGSGTQQTLAKLFWAPPAPSLQSDVRGLHIGLERSEWNARTYRSRNGPPVFRQEVLNHLKDGFLFRPPASRNLNQLLANPCPLLERAGGHSEAIATDLKYV